MLERCILLCCCLLFFNTSFAAEANVEEMGFFDKFKKMFGIDTKKDVDEKDVEELKEKLEDMDDKDKLDVEKLKEKALGGEESSDDFSKELQEKIEEIKEKLEDTDLKKKFGN